MFRTAVLALILLSSIIGGCRKDKLLTDSSARLEFSTDTLTFDTVFTSLGSAVRSIVVYNNASRPVEIGSVRIAGGLASPFRLNVDGVPGKEFANIRIEAKDSVYIFVAVTVDPNSANNPFVVEDSILFLLNGNQQAVVLNAWGQNAYFHYGELLEANTIWPNDKPHVVINSFAIDSNVTLQMQPGTRVYMHANSGFFVFGTLKAFGTKTDSIVFQGDRLEPFFKNLPGSWGFVYFTPSSKANEMEHVIIKDAMYGVYVDSVATDNDHKVVLRKCVIKNMQRSGIRVYQGSVKAENTLVFNVGDYCVEMFNGGTFDFKHCTFVNYGSHVITHQRPAVVLTNYYVVSNIVYPGLYYGVSALFENCIIYGSLEKELAIDSVQNGFPFNYLFRNCIIKTSESLPPSYFVNALTSDPQFISPYVSLGNAGDYHLNATSPAIDSGLPSGILQDLDDKPRDAQPDRGCYEY